MAKAEKICEVAIKDLRPYDKNAKVHSDEQVDMICNSIEEFGFISPCLIDKDNRIIAGHGRVMAAKKLGLKKVPCVYIEGLTEEQYKAYILVDNKLTELGGWDFDLLNSELDDIDLDMSQFGFDIETDNEAVDIFEDEIPETPKKAKSKLGQIYQLGEHRLMCGDSTDPEAFELLMGGERADMVFTDPPYGMKLNTDYSSMINNLEFAKAKNFTGGKKYEQGQVDEFHPEMVDAIFDIDADETFIWGADYFAELIPGRNEGSWIVWDKRANGNDDIAEDYSSDKMYGSCFELCWSKKKHKRDIARVKWAGVFGTEQEFDHKRHHPTQKPVKLAEWFLTRYSKENDIVIDLFGGSGSTLIACEQLNRKCRMMELDPKYVDVIIERWEVLTGKKAVLLNG